VQESIDVKFLSFRVSAHNSKEVIGYGTIGRAFVNANKFREKHESPGQAKEP
jgi:predicted thioesterase